MVSQSDPDSPESPLLQSRDAVEHNPFARKLFNFIGRHIHANRITAARLLGVPMTIGAHIVSPISGTVAYGVTAAADWVDGGVARNADQRTREGGILDEIVDRIINGAVLAYVALMHGNDNPLFLTAAGVSCLTAIVTQRLRGSFQSQLHDALRAVLQPEHCEKISPDAAIHGVEATAFNKLTNIVQSAGMMTLLAMPENNTVQNALSVTSLVACVEIGRQAIKDKFLQSGKPKA